MLSQLCSLKGEGHFGSQFVPRVRFIGATLLLTVGPKPFIQVSRVTVGSATVEQRRSLPENWPMTETQKQEAENDSVS